MYIQPAGIRIKIGTDVNGSIANNSAIPPFLSELWFLSLYGASNNWRNPMNLNAFVAIVATVVGLRGQG